MIMKGFPHYPQRDAMDCGPSCLKMISSYYGKNHTIEKLRERSYLQKDGVSLMGISLAAESIGFRTVGNRLTFEQLITEVTLPCIAHWNQNHFVVIYNTSRKGNTNFIHISDPAHGKIKYNETEFQNSWLSTKTKGSDKGVCLLIEPTPDFYTQQEETINKKSFSFLFQYLKPHTKLLIQLLFGMIAASLLQLVFPFLTQSIVDVGINNQDLSFITLVLIAQLVLFISQTSVEFVRSWILLHISTRINISLISDFLIKLMKLPIRFFDSKLVGDLMQRIQDHHRIEAFLTSSSLNILFSTINFVIFAAILAYYNITIIGIFLLGSTLYTAWVIMFMKKRRELDTKRFEQMSKNQSSIIQLINGMQEIKLNNCEKQKRWEWERIQAKLFKISIKNLSLNQYQQAGAVFFNHTKDIIITFIAASAVVNGKMTLGMMLAVQYILGQLNSPISQMISFIQEAQDAKLSLERLGEIHMKEDEELSENPKINELPKINDIHITNLSFQYEGPMSPFVLKNLNLIIPEKKITAIVGQSGSGKTTMIKMLLGFYQPIQGDIKIGNFQLNNISERFWRSSCGTVMQDGYIFSDTIARNIVVGDEFIDRKKLSHAVDVANIQEFIESLPLGYNTKIGQEGNGISQGQKQRILIARAVYKNPDFLYFDEATNALDANNEKVIMRNLNDFFKGKTVIIVAHRLSTVKNADQIVVLDKGQISEIGSHKQLTEKKGAYYNLVKNQLELGS
ncbi:MAG: peptidase domain-containing ABC transporter [Bacteroidales bacterium]|nr:peptidase domain-containing ABC transporter [Bacteroidales bacterium]